MLSSRLLTAPLAGLALFGVGGAAGSPDAAISNAALAPYRDVLLKDARALCSDLIRPPVIASSTPEGESCEQTVQGVFAVTAPSSVPRDVVPSLRATVSHLDIDGTRATGVFSFTAIERKRSTDRRIAAFGILALGNYRLSLEEVAGRWLVSSQARLGAVGDCQVRPQSRCRPGVEDLLFTLGAPVERTEALPTPPSVRRAGSRERGEFAAGGKVLVQSGCLACHKIGDAGNAGPGQNLTQIGAQLSSQQIEHALFSPREPMPSFKHLPAEKLHDLVRFLSLLRASSA